MPNLVARSPTTSKRKVGFEYEIWEYPPRRGGGGGGVGGGGVGLWCFDHFDHSKYLSLFSDFLPIHFISQSEYLSHI